MPRGRKAVPTKEATKRQVRDRLNHVNELAELPFDASKLSFPERKLLVVLADPTYAMERMTVGKVCAAAGVSYGVYRNAMANPDFLAAQTSILQSTIKQAILPLVRAGVKFAMEGSYRHWEALMKMAGNLEAQPDSEIIIRFASAAQPTVIDAEIVGNAPMPRLEVEEEMLPILPILPIDEADELADETKAAGKESSVQSYIESTNVDDQRELPDET